MDDNMKLHHEKLLLTIKQVKMDDRLGAHQTTKCSRVAKLHSSTLLLPSKITGFKSFLGSYYLRFIKILHALAIFFFILLIKQQSAPALQNSIHQHFCCPAKSIGFELLLESNLLNFTSNTAKMQIVRIVHFICKEPQ